MKESYIGDINDFYKYDLIEKLTQGKKCLVVWMRTGGDGDKLDYLGSSSYENHNHTVFNALKEIVSRNTRKLEKVEQIDTLSKCSFIDGVLTNEEKKRKMYFDEVYKKAEDDADIGLVFFDPDIGITPNDKLKKRKEYVYWDELSKIWKMKKDILVYQSHRHEKNFIENMEKRCELEFIDSKVFCFVPERTASTSFFIYITRDDINELCNKINEKWGELEK